MTKLNEMFGAVVMILALTLAISSCQKQEGPAEKAGKEMDKAIGSVGKQVDKAADNVKDAVKGK